jgi:hypothetical protein
VMWEPALWMKKILDGQTQMALRVLLMPWRGCILPGWADGQKRTKRSWKPGL